MAASYICRTFVSNAVGNGRIAQRDITALSRVWRSFTTTEKTGNKDDLSSPVTAVSTSRDPFPVFSDEKVQVLLSRLTGFDIMKLAGPKKNQLTRPTYKLLTDEELAKETAVAKEKLKYKLQMPPFMNPCKEIVTLLSVDPDLAGFDESKYVFTDISYGLTDRERSVVVRETDGTLKVAPLSLKARVNQIYNPREGREYFIPKMFEEQNLEKMISEKRYIYILERACCQFEPDDVDFVRTTHRVYNAINASKEFDVLRSTRHFGPLAFYLAWNQDIDYLLLDILNRDLVSDAQDLISLYCIIHQESLCSVAVKALEKLDVTSVVKAFIETDSRHKAQLELALQAMEDARRSKEKTEIRSSY